jgi:hypothetical protein
MKCNSYAFLGQFIKSGNYRQEQSILLFIVGITLPMDSVWVIFRFGLLDELRVTKINSAQWCDAYGKVK